MKYNFSYRDSYEWIHVICAWWVPEVKIEDVKFIERIRKDKIPVSLKDLVNFICLYNQYTLLSKTSVSIHYWKYLLFFDFMWFF